MLGILKIIRAFTGEPETQSSVE